MENKACIKT